ncbi:lytic transglycosylase domain-containing protein [Klebsiella pneumoniae]|nr:lytic transglycosylase domain-containing protein [Klebsiella pneumoniae]
MKKKKAGCLLIAFLSFSGNVLADDSDILLSMVSAPPGKNQMQTVWGSPSSLSAFKGFSRKQRADTPPPSTVEHKGQRSYGAHINYAPTKNDKFSDLIAKYSEKYNVASSIIRELINQESRFNPRATSHKGAQGLMQLMPGTASDCGVTDAYDVEQNIDCGVRYFVSKLDKYNSVSLALAAYNAGDKAVDKYQDIPPYKETQNYVKTIMGKLGYRG